MTNLQANDPISALFDLEKEEELFLLCRMAQIQSPFCFRAKRRSVLLANHLIDDEGKISRPVLEKTYQLLKNKGYILAVDGHSDNDITDHFLRVLAALKLESGLIEKLHQFGLPLCDQVAESLVKITLGVDEDLTDRHVIWGILSALLCPLRQSVGSCFATAPAIMIHEEQFASFLDDMQNLLSKRRMTRVFSGEEYGVPMSPTPGLGDLKKDLGFFWPSSKSFLFSRAYSRPFKSGIY